VYALVVNAFYQIISKRVMFAGKEESGKIRLGGPGAGFLYLLAFPMVSFAFFLLLSAALLYLGDFAESTGSVENVFTLAMAIVLAVRVSAYFSEATSHDLAKMLPLGLLGVALVRADFTKTFGESLSAITGLLDEWRIVLVYFAIVVIAEYLLRSIYLLSASTRGKVHPIRKGKQPE